MTFAGVAAVAAGAGQIAAGQHGDGLLRMQLAGEIFIRAWRARPEVKAGFGHLQRQHWIQDGQHARELVAIKGAIVPHMGLILPDLC